MADQEVAQIPVWLMRRSDLSPGDKWVAAVIFWRQGGNGHAWAGATSIARDAGLRSVRQVYAALGRLEAAGIIHAERRGSGRVSYRSVTPAQSAGVATRAESAPVVAPTPAQSAGDPCSISRGIQPNKNPSSSSKRASGRSSNLPESRQGALERNGPMAQSTSGPIDQGVLVESTRRDAKKEAHQAASEAIGYWRKRYGEVCGGKYAARAGEVVDLKRVIGELGLAEVQGRMGCYLARPPDRYHEPGGKTLANFCSRINAFAPDPELLELLALKNGHNGGPK